MPHRSETRICPLLGCVRSSLGTVRGVTVQRQHCAAHRMVYRYRKATPRWGTLGSGTVPLRGVCSTVPYPHELSWCEPRARGRYSTTDRPTKGGRHPYGAPSYKRPRRGGCRVRTVA